MKKEKRIPTLIGLLFLFAALFGGVYLTNRQFNFFSSASNGCIPVNLQVTNITHNSADVSFTTSIECLSTVNINDRIINDIRSIITPQPVPPSKIHYFQISGLSPTTSYQFTLVSGGQTVTDDNLKFITASSPITPVSASNLAWGKILTASLIPASSAIVYFNLPGASPLSSYVTTNGHWNISFSSSFNDTKTDWFSPSADVVDEEIVVISEDGQTTQIAANSSQNNPVPDIIIGQNRLTSSLLDIGTPSQSGNLGPVSQVVSDKSLDILNPRESETLYTNTPLFFGNAPPNSKVVITIESPIIYNGESSADPAGSWQWTPPSSLSPGEHTITASVQNSQTGLWDTVSRKFVVLAADNQPQFVASASATLIPSPTFTSTPFPTIIIPTSAPLLTPTASPTQSALQTPTLTLTPTIRTAHPSVSGTPPITGTSLPTVSFFIFGILLIASSYHLLIASTKKIS